MEKWEASEEIEREEEIENQLPAIQEENKNDLGGGVFGKEENGGYQSQNQTQHEK